MLLKISRSILLLFFFFALLLEASAPSILSAARYEELQQKVAERNSDISRIEQEIAGYKVELSKTQQESDSLKSAIQSIDLNRRKLGADIRLAENRIGGTEANIERIAIDMAASEEQIARGKAQIAAVIRAMDDTAGRSLVEIMFSNEDIGQALGEISEFQNIYSEIHARIEELRSAKDKMFEQKSEHEKEKNNLLGFHAELADKKIILDEERRSQDALLKQTKNKESDYKKMLADAEARKKQFEKELEDFAAQIKQEVDPASFPPPGSRVLSAPLEGLKITQRFGKTADSVRLYISGTHNGIDFAASRGTKVFSAADGTVVATGNTDDVRGCFSYGKWILIKHPNGLSTLYAHLDIIKVSAGQQVARGELIGYSGKTGYATGPHLHFGVYAAEAVKIMKYESSRYCKEAVIPIAPVNAYLDPEAYL